MNSNLAILTMMLRLRDLVERGETHEEICKHIAGAFGLWDRDGCFPEWLSRIVEGEQRDYENKEGFWYAE